MSSRSRAVALYLATAYGLTWIVWLPYVRAAASGVPPPGPFLYYLPALGPFAGAVVLTALYNASGGSVLAVALWHGTWNWVATSEALQGPWVATMTAIIMVVAPLIVWRWGASDLAARRKTYVSREGCSE